MKISIKIVTFLILLVCVFQSNASGDNAVLTDDGPTIQIFPNPVTDNKFTITSDVNIVEVVIINVLGQQIYKQEITNQNKIIIELETNENGIYLVQVRTADQILSTRRVLFR